MRFSRRLCCANVLEPLQLASASSNGLAAPQILFALRWSADCKAECHDILVQDVNALGDS